MRVLITGGLGVVGSQLARTIKDVIIIDAAEEPRNRWLISQLPYAKIYMHRLETFKELPNVLKNVDAIVHCAAHTGIPHSVDNPDDDWISNVDATRYLLECLRQSKRDIPTVVLSSIKPYRLNFKSHRVGNRYAFNDIKGVNEDCPLEPDEPYAASKLAQSALAQAYAHSYGLPIVTIRFSNLYGPAPCHGPRHGWLTWFCISKALNQTVNVTGNGYQTRDVLYTHDVTNAIKLALRYIKRTKGQLYNVGGGIENTVSVNEAVKLLGLKTVKVKARKNEDKIFVTDYSKFNKHTGWKPKVNVLQGIARVYDWAFWNKEKLRLLYE